MDRKAITQVPADILARDKPSTRPANAFDTLPKVLTVHMPWILPIPESQDINVMGHQPTVGAEVQTEITTAASALGKGVIGVLRSFTVYITNMLASTDVTFMLFIAGSPAPGFGAIKMFPRVASSLSNAFDCVLTIPPEAKIQAFFTNTDGGSYEVGVSYSGWVHTEAAAKRWMARGPGLL